MRNRPEPAKMQVQDLLPFALILVVVGIVIAFGLQVQGDIKDDIGVDSCAARTDGYTSYNETSNLCYNGTYATSAPTTSDFNATADAQEGVSNLSNKLPTIGLIGGIVVVITLLVGGFMALRSR